MQSNVSKEIISICHNDYKYFFSKPNVVGMALGSKYTNGVNTFQDSIHVFVTKKLNSNLLSSDALIPPLYKGIKTDVIETGDFICSSLSENNIISSLAPQMPNVSAPTKAPYTKKIRPLEPGFCISSPPLPGYRTGTLGYIVLDNQQITKTYCLLSTNDAFAAFNDAPIGSAILQPAWQYGGREFRDDVGELLRFYPLKFTNTIPNSIDEFNTINAAVAKFSNLKFVQLINPIIPSIGIPRGLTTPAVGENIQWTGCFTGRSEGSITSISATLKINYFMYGYAYFKDVILSTGTVHHQDYGALVLDKSLNALGLLFAESNNGAVICNLITVLKTLNISLLTI